MIKTIIFSILVYCISITAKAADSIEISPTSGFFPNFVNTITTPLSPVTTDYWQTLPACPSSPICSDVNGRWPAGGSTSTCPDQCTVTSPTITPYSAMNSIPSVQCPVGYTKIAHYNMQPEYVIKPRSISFTPKTLSEFSALRASGASCYTILPTFYTLPCNVWGPPFQSMYTANYGDYSGGMIYGGPTEQIVPSALVEPADGSYVDCFSLLGCTGTATRSTTGTGEPCLDVPNTLSFRKTYSYYPILCQSNANIAYPTGQRIPASLVCTRIRSVWQRIN